MAGAKADPEVEAMGTLAAALDAVEDEEARARVIRWAAERYSVTLAPGPKQQSQQQSGGGGAEEETPGEFESLGDLVSAAAPSTNEDRALVVAYWFQEEHGANTVNGQQVNTELKNLGHGVSRITDVMGNLVATRPQQLIQTKKGGTQKQGRKEYKVTKVGKDRVKALIAGTADNG